MRTLGPYEILNRIAVGGLAEIFLARARDRAGTERHFALKVLLGHLAESADHRQMLVDEASLTAHLDHPNIIKVYDCGESDGVPYIVMERVEGFDVSTLMQHARDRQVHIPLPVAAFIVSKMASALHYAHTRTGPDGRPLRIVHRDISPANVLLGRQGEVKLIDFGVAKADGHGRMDTKTGIIKGKLAYMAPEYALGKTQDARSDIFSASICLYELVTGRPAYMLRDPHALMKAVRNAAVEPAVTYRPELPPELGEIIAAGAQRDPEHRLPSAQHLHHALTEFLNRHAPGFSSAHLAQYLDQLVRPPKAPDAEDIAEARTAALSPDQLPAHLLQALADGPGQPELDNSMESTALLNVAQLAAGAQNLASLGDLARERDDGAVFSETDRLDVFETVASRPDPSRDEVSVDFIPTSELDISPLDEVEEPVTATDIKLVSLFEEPEQPSAAPSPNESFGKPPQPAAPVFDQSQRQPLQSGAFNSPSNYGKFGTENLSTPPAAHGIVPTGRIPEAPRSEERGGRTKDIIVVLLLTVILVSLLVWVFVVAR